VERHILAKGGFEVLSSISTLRTVWTKKVGDGEWRYERWRVPGQKFARTSLNGGPEWWYGCWVANPSAEVNSLEGIGWSTYGNNVQIERAQELKENLIDTATIDDTTRWFDRNESIVAKGIEKLDGKECYVLEFTNSDGEVAKRYFDTETYHKVCSIQIEHDSGGERVTRKYSNFKKFNGIVIAMKQTINSRSGTDVWEVKEFEHDSEFDFDELPMPDEVQVLIHRMRAKLELASDESVEEK